MDRTNANVLTYFEYTYTDASAQDRALRQSVLEKDGDRTTYAYDVLDRLLKAETRNSGGTLIRLRQYAYDGNSNRCRQNVSLTVMAPFSCTSSGSGVTSYSYNAANQLTAVGSATRSYDGNGNQTGSSDGWSLAYNPKDQTTSITRPGGTPLAISYTGPGQWERLTAGGTGFLTTQAGVTRAGSSSFTRDPDGSLME